MITGSTEKHGDRSRYERFASHFDEVRAFLASTRHFIRRARALQPQGFLPGPAPIDWEEAADSQPIPPDASAEEELRIRLTRLRGIHVRLSALQEALAAKNEELRLAHEELQLGRRLLEREHAKYVDLFEEDSLAKLFTDATTTVRDANRAAATMLAVEQRNLPGRLLIAFVARQDAHAFRAFVRPLWDVTEDEARAIVVRIRPRGHAVVRAKLSVHFIRGVNRRTLGLRWTITPVDQQPAA
jgi:PAS domain-containing protein